MTDDDNPTTEETVSLGDLSAEKVLSENDQVAELVDEKEEEISALEDEVSDLKAEASRLEDEMEEQADEYEEEIENLEEDLAARDEIIEDIKQSEREEQLSRLRDAYSAATGKDPESEAVEDKLAEYEGADINQLKTTVEMFEEVAERSSSASPSETEEELDNPGASAEGREARKQQLAQEMGFDQLLDEASTASPEGVEVDPNN